MASATAASELLRCPKNLKECIDWVLRATERDNGQDNIDKLKNALNVELSGFKDDSDALTQLVHGLCLFMGYPSCLCSLKANVDKSLKDISKKLKKDFEAVQSCASITTLNLNCSNCISKDILCKCCVISCIKDFPKQCPSNCPRLNDPSQKCLCKGTKEKCCKDLHEKLKASLSLLNLKADMEGLCQCPEDCCNDGVCTQKGSKGCKVCTPSSTSDYTVTGLGLLRPSPKRLAEKLNDFLGDSSKKSSGCTCKCGTSGSPPSCCCLACGDKDCSESCNEPCKSKGSPGCPCTKTPSDCPRKTFCEAIDGLRIACNARDRTCCSGGTQCHCQLPGSSSKACSGQGCCVVTVVTSTGPAYYHSLKCLLRRVVKFFTSFDSSKSECSKLCCELLCVRVHCWALGQIYNKGLKECKTCKENQGGNCPQGTQKSCCNGNFDNCKSPNCCVGCNDCSALKFRNAFNELRFAGPCGQELWRVFDDFLHYCCNVAQHFINRVKEKINAAKGKCQTCKQAGTSKKPCTCSGSPCLGCQEIRDNHKDIMAILRHGYVSSYDSSKASWPSLPSSSSGSKCCCGQDPSSCSKCSSSGCSSNPSSCDPKNCCDACPQRKAAKIFLGMLPCMYWGLKILYDRCKYGSDFPTWYGKNGQKILVPASILHAPDLKKFLDAWGFGSVLNPSLQAMVLPGLLENLFPSGSSVNFKNLFETSKKYFTSFSSRSLPSGSPSPSSKSNPPTTVRSMLLWLYGLRFQKHFSELVEICKSLCLPFGNSFNADAFCYYIHTCCSLLPVSVISAIEDSSSALSLISSSSDWKDFSYPEDPFELRETFCDFVRKLYIPLTFLYYQCERTPGQAGWQFCYFGRTCKTDGTFSSSSPCCPSASKGYLCTANSTPSVHSGHCKDGTGQSCLGFGSGTCSDSQTHNKPDKKTTSTGKACTPCSHPLMRFLTADPSCPFKIPSSFARLDFSQTPPAILEASQDFLTMGFTKEKLSSTAKSGSSLAPVLKFFCDTGFYPLARLTEFSIFVSIRPPSTLLELLTFFRELWFSNFLKALAEYASKEPGKPSGQNLKIALQNLFNHNSNSHSNDLFSLFGCDGQKKSGTNVTCGPYLFFIYNIDGVFDKNFLGLYLSWVCHLAENLKRELESFYKEAKGKFSCCMESSSKCKIVECLCALPFLYRHGFGFRNPGDLNCVYGNGQHAEDQEGCTKKSCKDFVSQLGEVLKKISPPQVTL